MQHCFILLYLQHCCDMPASPNNLPFLSPNTGRNAWFKGFGTTASLVCAVHCAAMPLLIGILPVSGLGSEEGFFHHFGEMALICVGAGFGLYWLFAKNRQTRHFYLRTILILAGFSVVLASRFVLDLHSLSAFGALLIAIPQFGFLFREKNCDDSCCHN